MFENSAVKIATTKLVSASAPLIPGTLILISGIVIWKLWRTQAQLQTKTSELSNELNAVKKQVTEIKVANKADKTKGESVADLSSSLKKMASIESIKNIKLPWSKAK